MKTIWSALVAIVCFVACQPPEETTTTNLKYPVSNKVDSVDIYFGEEVPDPYRWLEDDRSEATAKWVTSQNGVTQSYLKEIPFRDQIKERLTELYDYERVKEPIKHGDYDYFYKNDGLQNQNVLFRSEIGYGC